MKALALFYFFVGIIALTAIATYLILDWAERRRNARDTGDDSRQIDIIKRGQVCPWDLAE